MGCAWVARSHYNLAAQSQPAASTRHPDSRWRSRFGHTLLSAPFSYGAFFPKVYLIYPLPLLNQVGAQSAPLIFPALHARKMAARRTNPKGGAARETPISQRRDRPGHENRADETLRVMDVAAFVGRR